MNTLSIKINQQQDGPACIQQNQLPQNDLHSNLISRNACYSLTICLPTLSVKYS